MLLRDNIRIAPTGDGEQLQMAADILSEMKGLRLYPNNITYSILMAASERYVQLNWLSFVSTKLVLSLFSIAYFFSIVCRSDDLEIALMLLSQAKEDGIVPTLNMYRCIIGKLIRSNCLHLLYFYHKKSTSLSDGFSYL